LLENGDPKIEVSLEVKAGPILDQPIEPIFDAKAIRDSQRASRPAIAGKVIRLRDKEHKRFVASLPCLVCGRVPVDAHHLRFAQPRALGRKVSDEFTVPVCRLHHREIHRQGDEKAWWASRSIDPLPLALELWRKTHPT
jgi:hypothetical protein